MSAAKLSIAICELHHPALHGQDSNSTPGIDGHYIASYVIDPDEFINDPEECNAISAMARNHYAQRCPRGHNRLRNYRSLVTRPEYFQPQLVQLTQLQPGEECVAAIKTHLITRMQRRWRAFAANRRRILHKRMQPGALAVRETTGQWPEEIRTIPRLGKLKQA
jgi:hypothetical protein